MARPCISSVNHIPSSDIATVGTNGGILRGRVIKNRSDDCVRLNIELFGINQVPENPGYPPVRPD